MDRRLGDILAGRENNHILPFFWMHDGRHEVLGDIVESIYNSGARAFCVESRPHENFCKDEWWYDMDLILAEAKKPEAVVDTLVENAAKAIDEYIKGKNA